MLCRVNLATFRLPQLGESRKAVGERQIIKFTDREFEGILVTTDPCQYDTSLLVQIVLGQKLKDVMCAVEVTSLQECLHPFLQVLDRAASLNLLKIKLSCLSVPEFLEVALGELNV